MIEFFSGKARVSKMASWLGLAVRSIDILYDETPKVRSKFSGTEQRSAMDICGEAGFVLLVCCEKKLFYRLLCQFLGCE